MKSIKYFLFLFILILAPYKVYAIDLTIGPSICFVWLDEKQKTLPFRYSYDADPAFLYGPIWSLKFNDDFNLTFTFLTGDFTCRATEYILGDFYTNTGIISLGDVELVLYYRLNEYFQVFAGAKYIYWTYVGHIDSFAERALFVFIRSLVFGLPLGIEEFDSRGPMLGLRADFPIAENLFLLAKLGGFYLWGKDRCSTEKFTYKEYGINSNLALEYRIQSFPIAVSLGGRFQYSQTGYYDVEDGNRNKRKQKIYGITLAVTDTL